MILYRQQAQQCQLANRYLSMAPILLNKGLLIMEWTYQLFI